MLLLLLLLGLILGQLEVTEARQHRTIQLSGFQVCRTAPATPGLLIIWDINLSTHPLSPIMTVCVAAANGFCMMQICQ